MSGGQFNYEDMYLFNLLEENIKDSNLVNLLKVLGDWVHAYDWYVSGDTSREEYLKEKQQALDRIKAELRKCEVDELHEKGASV